MEPTTTPKTRRIEVRLSDEKHQFDAERTIALSEVEATHFLEALERPDGGTVARLEDLRRRA